MMFQQQSQIVSFLIILAVSAAALWVAAEILDGFRIDGVWSLLGVALIFAIINSTLKPIALLLGLPLTIITLGLFIVVINACLLLLTAFIGDVVGLEVALDEFLDAVLAAIIVSVVSWALNTFIGSRLRWSG